MDYVDVMHFLGVAETGSVREAAASMHISQPAVSRRVITLERQLGVQLFRRTPTGMILTPAGDHLREMALDMRNRLERAAGVMEALRFGARSFTLTCPEMTAHHFIAPFIAGGAPVAAIRAAIPSEVYGELRKGADVAINTSEPPAHLASHTLSSTLIQVQYSGTPPFPVQDGNAELAEVVRYPVLLPGYGRAVESQVRLTADRAGLDLSLATTTTDPIIAQAMAAAGRGNAVVIEPAAYDLQHAFVVHQGKPLVVHFFAAWDPAHYAAKEIEAFAEDLQVWFKRLTPFPADELVTGNKRG